MSVTTPLSPLSVATALPLGQQRFWRTTLPQFFMLFMLVPFAAFVTLAKVKPPDNLVFKGNIRSHSKRMWTKGQQFLTKQQKAWPAVMNIHCPS